jgi:guanylate kinase
MKNLLILLAKTGAGKSTVENSLISNYGFEPLISSTTRDIRPGEIDGFNYYFNSKEVNKIAGIEITPEWRYWVEASEFDRINDKGIMSVISLRYAEDIIFYAKSIGVTCNIIYIDVPKNVRKERIMARGETEESVEKRLSFEDVFGHEDIEFPCDFAILNGNQPPENVLIDLSGLLS